LLLNTPKKFFKSLNLSFACIIFISCLLSAYILFNPKKISFLEPETSSLSRCYCINGKLWGQCPWLKNL
jgi:hypothetical protein